MNKFTVIINWFKSLFKRNKPAQKSPEIAPTPIPSLPSTSTPSPPPQSSPVPLAIPHPEEPPDYSKTIDNATTEGLLTAWFKGWRVPLQDQSWWRNEMNIMISLQYSVPAATISETRQMWIRPEWANPGVIAHELAHVSYSLLTESQKAEFSAKYKPLKKTDPLIRLLYSQNSYGLSTDIEGHAEVYRYLGDKMPEPLKQYYPKLF